LQLLPKTSKKSFSVKSLGPGGLIYGEFYDRTEWVSYAVPEILNEPGSYTPFPPRC
jgi:hypothetical protein